MRNTFKALDLINFIGYQVNYKGYDLIISEINGNFARLTHPITGNTANVPKIILKELIENKLQKVPA